RGSAVQENSHDNYSYSEFDDRGAVERPQLRECDAQRPHHVSDRTSSNHFMALACRAPRARDRSSPSSIRRSMSREYLISVASHNFGYIEMFVKPGMVLISLTRMRFVPRSRKKSTRA